MKLFVFFCVLSFCIMDFRLKILNDEYKGVFNFFLLDLIEFNLNVLSINCV